MRPSCAHFASAIEDQPTRLLQTIKFFSITNIIAGVSLFCSSIDSLLVKVSLILVSNSKLLEAIKLAFLNSLHLQALILQSLPDHGAFLQVIKPLLLFHFGVHADLITTKEFKF